MAKTVKPETDPMIPVDVIVSSIERVAAGMKQLSNSRLNKEAIVLMVAASSRVSKETVRLVINNLESLERQWLKPK